MVYKQLLIMKRSFYSILITVFIHFTLLSQVLNDECKYAIALPKSYCSEDAEYTNVGATSDPSVNNTCVDLKWENGVWFSYVPHAPGMLIRVFGSGQSGTLQYPKIVLFEKCGQYLQCSPGKTIGNDELIIDDLTIGQRYYIMIESSIGGEGTFKLCVNDFIPVPVPESDCSEGVVLCDKSSFVVNSLVGNGNNANEIDPNSCIQEEFASAWYKWTCDTAGTLTFVLTPNNFKDYNTIADDLDFAVYELPNGVNNCSGKIMIRCEASGANTLSDGSPAPLSQWSSCNGPTGLAGGDPNTTEPPGCPPGNNSFVSALNMESGKSYALIVNNYSRSGLGFKIEFGGNGTFLGPKPDFQVNANKQFECDKSVIFTNLSSSATDSIIEYNWNFGDRCVPDRSKAKGPISGVYQSFGNKTASLTVLSSRGCTVTKIKEFYVEPCCKDTSTLKAGIEIKDLKCYGIPDGKVLGRGIGGSPEYQFSLNNGDFRPNPFYSNLDTGYYKLVIQDIKGCSDTIVGHVDQPEKLIADAGEDKVIDLGDFTNLNGDYTPRSYNVDYYWEPNYNLEDFKDLRTKAYPYETTTYKLIVKQKDTGCTSEDTMTIRVNKNRKIWIPNVFTPNGDGFNEKFTAFNVKAATGIDELMIFDRWGELIYDGKNLPLGDISYGWDGRFKDQKVNPGVYVYLFKIRFLDNAVIDYSGDVTVLK